MGAPEATVTAAVAAAVGLSHCIICLPLLHFDGSSMSTRLEIWRKRGSEVSIHPVTNAPSPQGGINSLPKRVHPSKPTSDMITGSSFKTLRLRCAEQGWP